MSHVGCVSVVEEVLELLGYGRCESYWGKCGRCQRTVRLSGKCEKCTYSMRAVKKE